jgi:hypothetical protein
MTTKYSHATLEATKGIRRKMPKPTRPLPSKKTVDDRKDLKKGRKNWIMQTTKDTEDI